MASKFTAPGVEACSTLNPEQWNEFFNEMSKTVWKIDIELKPHRYSGGGQEHKFHTGVCISSNGLILTRFFDPRNLLRIYVHSPNGGQYFEADLVHHEEASGLALVQAKNVNNCNFTNFALERKFRAGKCVYGIVYPRQASSSILMMGHLVYKYNHDAEFTSTKCPMYRKVDDLPEDIYLGGLGNDVALLQISGLGASNEFQGRAGYKSGLTEGLSTPVFDATGCLIGLVVFQYGVCGFAIHVDCLQSFHSRYSRFHGESNQYGQRRKKRMEQSSS